MASLQSLTTIQSQLGQLCTVLSSQECVDPGCVLWEIIDNHLDHKDPNVQYWWETVGYLLENLCRKAGYSIDAQCRYLLLFYFYLAPHLGSSANTSEGHPIWPSFMTDDFTPVEMGWDWGRCEDDPVIRLSIEPIGLDAGKPNDSHNEKAANLLLRQLSQVVPGIDLSWYNHLYSEFLPCSMNASEQRDAFERQEHKSRVFIGFDLGRDSMTTKAYFFPASKAVHNGQTNWSAITTAIASLPDHPPFPAYEILRRYQETSREGSKLRVEMAAIDCVTPAASRMKIYFRTTSTSLDSVRTNMTLGAHISTSAQEKGLSELEKLWRLVFGQERDVCSTEELRHKNHRTSGILYYVEMRPGQNMPVVKVYMPVRHYGKSDVAVMIALEAYLGGRGQGEQAKSYIEALKVIRPGILFSKKRGTQTYIGCAILEGNLKLTSYINPQVFAQGNCRR